MSRPVLLLLDYQVELCKHGALGEHARERGVLTAAAAMLEEFRRRDLPRLFVRACFDEHYTRMTSAAPFFRSIREQNRLQDDDPLSAICDEVSPLPGEPVITKGGADPFIGTNLTQKLAQLQPTELVLGGVATNFVVEATARTGSDSGYHITVLEDLCSSFDDETHTFSVQRMLPAFSRILTSHQLTEELKRT
ncbi:cysteine hydrolase [Streptomyces sp. WAC 01529]|uniref:cysteine hydrolase family protein n=1 Tax=Streptomyces sp. WAC 01529 TaxID=2203205 RepID=UPI000F6D69C5|nr:isochorismatase family cysteine hydrolase [Streptomyces sp. WAC 01529]AZM56290.1 cysteine hydrolase [Streptomyces sp. WAC 01529]